jgi:hypothetical protein
MLGMKEKPASIQEATERLLFACVYEFTGMIRMGGFNYGRKKTF